MGYRHFQNLYRRSNADLLNFEIYHNNNLSRDTYESRSSGYDYVCLFVSVEFLRIKKRILLYAVSVQSGMIGCPLLINNDLLDDLVSSANRYDSSNW